MRNSEFYREDGEKRAREAAAISNYPKGNSKNGRTPSPQVLKSGYSTGIGQLQT